MTARERSAALLRSSAGAIIRGVAGILVVGAVVAVAQPALACPNCKNNLAEQGSGGQNLARGFYYSILFMMGMPFAILGGFSGYMYLEVRRARRQAAQQAAPPKGGPGAGPCRAGASEVPR